MKRYALLVCAALTASSVSLSAVAADDAAPATVTLTITAPATITITSSAPATPAPAAATTSAAPAAAGAAPGAPASTLVPVRRLNNWMQKYETISQKARKGGYDLVFIGDSITEGWSTKGKDVWEKYYGNRKALNLGIGGDRTQHVLWRLDNGNFDGVKPKLCVVMIGTNNSNNKDNTAEEIGEGIKAIVNKVREKTPESKILLLGVFPRGPNPSPQREKNAKASEIASKLADDRMVFYMDIGAKFLNEDGTMSKEIMSDYLHPGAKGYEIWAQAIEPKVADLLGEPIVQAAPAVPQVGGTFEVTLPLPPQKTQLPESAPTP